MMNSRAPRVLQIGKYYPPHRGGMETHLEQLAGELNKSVDLEVLVSNESRKTAVEWVDGVKVSRIGKAWELASTPICPQMTKAIHRARADLVHVHLPNPAAVVALLASGYRGPTVVTWHSDVVRQRVLAGLFQPLLNAFIRRCSAIIVSSPNYLLSSPVLRANRRKCRVIPFGIPPELFQRECTSAVAAIRKRFGSRIILTVGRCVYYKGLEYLIRSMLKIPDAQLLIIGDGPRRLALEAETRAFGLSDRVAFLGSVADPVPYYQACDIFALASIARSEAFGIVQLEALAAGKPVVNTLLPSGVPFVSVDGVTGFSVTPGDSDALAKALSQLLNQPALRSKFGQEGIRRVNRHFTLQRMVDRTLRLYAELVDGEAEAPVEQRWFLPPVTVGRSGMGATAAQSLLRMNVREQ
ncbi:MAG: glycosyltransferase [Candidatus Binatus sp.]